MEYNLGFVQMIKKQVGVGKESYISGAQSDDYMEEGHFSTDSKDEGGLNEVSGRFHLAVAHYTMH